MYRYICLTVSFRAPSYLSTRDRKAAFPPPPSLWATSCLAVSRFWSYCWPGWVRAGCKEVTLEDNSILLQWAVHPSTSRRMRLNCRRWLIIQTIASAMQPGCLGLLGLGFPKVPFLTEHSELFLSSLPTLQAHTHLALCTPLPTSS